MLGRTLICLGTLPWPIAAAAPWTQPEDTFYARTSIGRETVEGLSGWRSDLYLEYGLSDTLTVTGKIEGVSYDDAGDFNTQGWRTTVRQRLYRSGTFNLTIEGGALKGAAVGGRNGCDTLGLEVRGGASWSGDWQERQTIAFAESAVREHEDCRRTRYEFGLGQALTEQVWSVTQVWLERGDQNAQSDKFQSELMWRRPFGDFSVGYRSENGGAFTEESIFVAVAKTF